MSNDTKELLEALDNAPGDTEAIAALERAWSAEENYTALAEELPERARAIEDPTLRANYLSVASSAAILLGDKERQTALLTELVELVPDGTALGEVVVSAFEADQAWENAANVLLTMVTTVCAEDPPVRARLLFATGKVYEDKLFNREKSIPFYNQAFKADRTFVEPLAHARAIFRQQGHWGTVVKLYNAELKVTSDAAKQIELLKKIGDIHLQETRDAESALKAYSMAKQVQQAQGQDVLPAIEEGIASAEAILAEDAEGVEVSSELMDAPEESAAAPAQKRTAVPKRAVRKKGSDVDVPAAPLGEALPDVLPAVEGQIDAASADYIPLMLDAARASAGREATAYYGRAISRMFELDAEKQEIIQVAVEAVQNAEDGVVAVRDLLFALVDRRFTSEDIADALQEAGADGASVYAMAFYGAANKDRAKQLRDEAGDWGEIDALALEWAEKGNWRRAHGVFKSSLEAAGVEDADREAYRLQAYLCMALDQDDKAADALRRVLRRNKTERAGLELAAALYGTLDREANQADALRTLVGALEDGDNAHKGLLLRKVARIYKEELKQDQQVVLTLQQLAEVEPYNLDVLDELAGRLEEMKRYPDLVEVLRTKAAALQDPVEQIELYQSIAELYEERFSNQNEAIRSWEEVIALDPDHPKALERLDELYEKRREWDKLIDVKRRRYELAEDDSGVARLREAAELAATRMRDRELAESLWKEVLDVEPGDTAALAALEQIHDREKDYDALADVLSRRIPSIEDPKERSMSLLKLGQLYSDRLDEPEKSLDVWLELLELEPENARARDAVRKAYVELERFDDLEAFYAQNDAWAEYVRQMESLAGTVDDPTTQVDLLFRAANTYIDKLDTPERATRSLERILSAEPDNAEAARLLVPIYEARNDVRKLPQVLEIVLDNTDEPDARYDLFVRLAELQAKQLRDPESALTNYVEALAIRPHAEDLYRAMLDTAERAGDWHGLDSAWTDARMSLEGDETHADAWLTLTRMHGNMLEVRLNDDDAALDAADAILNQIPGDDEALSVRERIFRRRESWDDLLDVLELQYEKAQDESHAAEVLAEICRVHEEEREDAYAAIERYNDLLGLRPGDRDVLTSLRSLHYQTEDYTSFADVTQQLIADAPKDEAVSLRGELAQVYVDALDQPEDAISAYAAILEERPTDRDAREGLERLVDNPDVEALAAKTLQPVYERANDWRGVVNMLEIQAEHVEDDAERVQLLSRVGELQSDTLHDFDAAFEAWSRVLLADPSSDRAREQVEAAAERRRNWEDVVNLYEEIFESVPQGTDEERALAVAWGERLADLYDGRMDDIDAAIDAQQRVLLIEPTHWASRRMLSNDLLPRAERWNDLVDVLIENIDLQEEAMDRRMTRGKLAEVYATRLEDGDAAVGVWNDVLAEDPEDSEALESLDALYEALDDPTSQAEIIDRRIAQQSPGSSQQLELKLRLAQLSDHALGDVDRTLSLLQDVVQVSPRHEEARSYLETLLDNEDAALRASSILEPLYAEDEDDEALCRVLVASMQWEQDPEKRKAAFHRIARMQSSALEDHHAAYITLDSALREFPEDKDLLSQIYREAEVSDQWGELAQLLDELADDVPNPETAVDYRTRVAVLRREHLQDVEGAADAWRQVLDAEPNDQEALDALDTIYQDAAAWPELVEIVQRKADLAEGAQAQELHFRAAALYENQLEDIDEAIDVLRGITLDDPTNLKALNELERLYEQDQRWEDLVETYEAKIEAAEDAQAKRDLQMQRGLVLAQGLEDDDRAADAYRAALEYVPNDREALDALDETLVRTENFDALQEVLEQKLQQASEDESLELMWRRATLRENELADLDGALKDYAHILSKDPAHEGSVHALESMIERGDAVTEAAKVLDGIYRNAELWTEVARLNVVRLDQAFDPAERRALFIENADLYEQKIEDDASAFASLRQAFEEAPEASDPERLEQLAERLSNWEELAEVYDHARDDAPEATMRRDVGVRLARVREERLDDVDGAIEAYVRVQEEQPEDKEALQALDRLYQQTGQWETLVEVLRQRIDAAGDESARNGLRLRQANVLQEFIDDGPEAIRVYQEVLHTDEQNDDAIAALEGMASTGTEVEEIAAILEPIYRSREGWSELVALYDVRAQYADMPDDRYRFLVEMARLQSNELQDPAASLQSWSNALVERPSEASVRDAIEDIAREHDLWQEAYEGYHQVLDADPDDDDRAEIARRMADVAYTHLQDEGSAENAWLTALEVQPEDGISLEALDKLYVSQERWPELSEILTRRRDVVFETDALTELTVRHARLFENQLEDLGAAEATWVEALDLKPDNHEALKALEGIYLQTENWDALYENFEQQLLLAQESDERALLLRQMAQLNESALERPEEAVDCWNRLLQETPGDREALLALATLHHGADDSMELVDTYAKLIETSEDDEERADLYRRIASIQSWTLENDFEGVENWKQVLAIAPEDSEALQGLRILYERMGDEASLAQNFERQIELGHIEEEELASVYERLGGIYSDVLSDNAKAIGAWTEVRTRVPGHDEALQRLDDLYTVESKWPELVSVLEEKAELAEFDEDKIELYRRVAGIWTNEAPDADKAASAWEHVVDLDLTDDQGIAELERLYAELEEWEALASLHVDRIEVIDDSWEKVSTLRKAAEVYRDKLDRKEDAYYIFFAALREAPLDDELRAEVETLAGASGQWAHLAQEYVSLIGSVSEESSEDDALPLMLAVARIHDEELEDLDMAEVFYERALAVDPENEQAILALENIHRRTENWDALVDILRRRVDVTYEPDEQGRLLRELARVNEDMRAEFPAAADALYEALEINDQDGEALDALERIQTDRGAWTEVIDVLDRRLMQTYEPGEQTPLRVRIAELWRDNVRDDEKAIDAYQDVLMGDPNHIESMEALEALYGRNELWDDYVEILDRRATVDATPELQVELYNKQAYVHEVVFEDIDRAVNALQSALQAVPNHMESFDTLERIFEEQERWYDLVDTYERHAGVVEGEEQAEVLDALGSVHYEQLEAPEPALEAYEQAIAAHPTHNHALQRAAEISTELERFENAAAHWDALAEASEEEDLRRTALLSAGTLYIEPLGRPQDATERFKRVLASNEEDVEALQGLYESHYAAQEWEQAIQAVRNRIEFTRELDIRSELLASIAEIHAQHLDDTSGARDLYEEAIDLDPTNIYAAAPLVDINIQEERWERARPLLELLLNDERYQTEPEDQAHLHFLLGRSCEELAYDTDAVDEYRRALDLAPSHGDALRHMAIVKHRLGQTSEAVDYQKDYLAAWQHGLEPKEQADGWATLARYQADDGDEIGAQQSYQEALAIDENHGAALRGLVDLSDDGDDPALVIDAKSRLLTHTDDPLDRFELLMDLGNAHMELGDLKRAIDHFRAAVELQSNSRQALIQLLKAYQEDGNWARATEVLGVLAKSETNPERKTKYFYTIALMFRDQIGDEDEAINFLNVVLDNDPTFLEAFQDLDAILTEKRDWKGLEKAYGKMLERIADDNSTKARALRKLLFKNLGEVYRSRLEKPQKAIQAFRYASDMDPSDVEILEILAALYSEHGEDPEDAIAAHRRMIAQAPVRVESYRALFEAYLAKKDIDRAWNMAAALVMFNVANNTERPIYEEGLAQGVQHPRKALSREQWRQIRHPELDPLLTDLMQLMGSHVRPYVGDIRDHGLHRRKDRVDINEPMPMTRAMQHAVRLVGAAPTDMYSRREENGLRNANTDPAAIIVGNDMLQAKPERDLLFEVGKMTTLMRPEFYLASALPSTDYLRNVLTGALAAVTGQIVGATDVEAAQRIAHEVQRQPEQVQARIRQAVQAILNSGENPSLSRWLRAVDHTANRVGLLLSGDLTTACRIIKDEPHGIGKASAQDKIRELIIFSVSEEFFEMRSDLGLSMD